MSEVNRNGLTLAQCLSGVGQGWRPLVEVCFNAAAESGARVVQVKQKFGTMRFYAYGLSKEAVGITCKAEAASATICEECGDVGKLRNDKGWFRTSCDKHAPKEDNSILHNVSTSPSRFVMRKKEGV